ncbi:MAG TPA: acyl-CoA dehydrogenase family protein [Dehalococcoidia bacterium]|nr:acyl-CoA dehydrogenase family protein [Dehalococcoidia bacterium]
MTAPADAALPGSRAELVAAARALAPQTQARRVEIERGRRVPLPLIEAMKAAGLFRILLPRALGGIDGHPLTAIRVIEEVSRADGAVGWNLMIGMEQAMFAGFVREDVARAIWGLDPDAITAGSGQPRGRAVAVPGGYRVSGQWPFNSGCHHASWLWGNCRLYDDETAPRTRPDGTPVFRFVLFPAEQAEIVETWHTGGLRGTGSDDFAVRGQFVPEEHTFTRLTADPTERPWPDDPLFCFPYMSIAAVTVCAVPLGIARAAIEALLALAQAKAPTGQTSLLCERAAVQAGVARAEALLRSADAFLRETVEETWACALRGEPATLDQRAQLRLAATHAGITAAQAVDLMYNAGGASSIYEANPLERCFRDVHTATAHAQIWPANFETVGQVLLGLPPSGAYL